MIYTYCEIIITTGSVNIYLSHTDTTKREGKSFSPCDENSGFGFNNFPYHTAEEYSHHVVHYICILQLAL